MLPVCICLVCSVLWCYSRHTDPVRSGQLILQTAQMFCIRHVDELATEPFLMLHHEHGTGYNDGAETAAIDGLVSS